MTGQVDERPARGRGKTAPRRITPSSSWRKPGPSRTLIQEYPPAFRSTNAPYYFEPALYFSPDCSVALVVGAHPLGPENNLAQVIDLRSVSVINSIEFSAPFFNASVADGSSPKGF